MQDAVITPVYRNKCNVAFNSGVMVVSLVVRYRFAYVLDTRLSFSCPSKIYDNKHRLDELKVGDKAFLSTYDNTTRTKVLYHIHHEVNPLFLNL